MTRRLVTGGLVLDATRAQPERLDLLLEGGRILALLRPGESGSLDAERLDASRRLIIPGLINAHTHSHLALAKGIQDRWTLELHLNAGTWTNALLDHEQRRLAAELSAAEMLSKGCTTAYDLHNELPTPTADGMAAVAEGYRAVGQRVLLAPMLADRPLWHAIPGLLDALPDWGRRAVPPPRDDHGAAVAALAALAAGWRLPAAEAGLAFAPTIPLHCSDALMRGAAEVAGQHGLQLHMHLAESKVQAIAGQQRYGHSLTAHLAVLGLLSPRFTAAHALWLDGADYDLLAAHGAKVAHNPGSNLRLGCGVMLIGELRRRGIPLGLGTDAASCADGQNVFETLRLAALLSRLGSPDTADWLPAREAFDMATRGGARLLGREHELGLIAPGYLADLVMLDLDQPHYLPLNDALRQVVFAENGGAIDRVLVGGETVVRGGRLLRVDLPRLADRAGAAAERLAATFAATRETFERLAPFVEDFCLCLRRRPLPHSRLLEGAL